ncbi:hypothetical protein SDJN02_23228, partial [Cucurbita argyrosperma subsp. argyrosperma]
MFWTKNTIGFIRSSHVAPVVRPCTYFPYISSGSMMTRPPRSRTTVERIGTPTTIFLILFAVNVRSCRASGRYISLLKLEIDALLCKKVKHFVFEAAECCFGKMGNLWRSQSGGDFSHEMGEWLRESDTSILGDKAPVSSAVLDDTKKKRVFFLYYGKRVDWDCYI